MKLIMGDRQSGKTTKLIEEVLAAPDRAVVIIVANQRRAEYTREAIARFATELGMEDAKAWSRAWSAVLTVEEYLNPRRWTFHDTRFLVDDLQEVLPQLLRREPVEAATITTEVEVLPGVLTTDILEGYIAKLRDHRPEPGRYEVTPDAYKRIQEIGFSAWLRELVERWKSEDDA